MTIYYTVYKTTNLINGKYYIGAHATENPNDNYLGSGSLITKAVRKYGKENFQKEILFHAFDKESMYWAESQLVILSENSYNCVAGGRGGHANMAVMKDINGIFYKVSVYDNRIKTGELIGVTKNCKQPKISESLKGKNFCPETEFKRGYVSAKDQFGNIIKVEKEAFDLDDSLVGITHNRSSYIHQVTKEIKIFDITENIDILWINSTHLSKIRYCDKTGTYLGLTDINDERFISMEIFSLQSFMRNNPNLKCHCGTICNTVALYMSHFGNCSKYLTCPHCGKTGIKSNIRRWHFDNCKQIQGV